jgi:predicted O-methyltransferase YrrM
MEFISETLLKYCERFSEPESALLQELNRQTHLKISSPRMLSGHLQGRFLSMISCIMQPTRVLEIGTYTGYSALCLAEGLQDKGMLYTIDPNEETNHFAKKFFDRSPLGKKIRQLEGNASELIPGLNETFDLVFIDADKKNYAAYFDLVLNKTRKGALIISDNVLWSGKVLDEKKDPDTLAIHHYNEKLLQNKKVTTLVLPVRDGLSICRKN